MVRSPQSKVMSLEAAAAWRTRLATAGKHLVVTNGCFDLLHRGHVEYLNRARALGDALLVAINSDASVTALKGPGRPLVGEADRAYVLAGLEAVDAVVAFGTARATVVLRALRPDIYVKGGDYTPDSLDPEEREALREVGSRIEIMPLVAGLSTTALVSRLEKATSSEKPASTRARRRAKTPP